MTQDREVASGREAEEMTSEVQVPQFRTIVDGELKLHFHSGQSKVWRSNHKIVAAIASAQWGKTIMGPPWLDREMQHCGPGDYLVVTSEFPLLTRVVLPEMHTYFIRLLNWGRYRAADRIFESFATKEDGSPAYRILLGSATNPDSLESATAKAAWLDEAGQHQFTRQAWEAVQSRVVIARDLTQTAEDGESISQGRILITTTPYEHGWFKSEVYDRWQQGDPAIDVIQGDALDNPAFSREEYYRQQEIMPRWKFDMRYRGMFERPAGMIYDAFDEDVCSIPRFNLPTSWPRYVGHDFGPNNTAAVWYASDPATGYLYAYRSYLAGGLSAFDHAQKFKTLSQGERIVKRVGGANHEDGWRESFTAAGWPISKPREREVEVGINIVYGWHQQNKLFVFKDMTSYLDEKLTYSRKLDDNYQPTEVIDNKSSFHHMDAERYILSDFGPERIQERKGIHVRRRSSLVRVR